ncbi:hypothetical protein [Streptomyces sp. NEAU-YJ-81]|uniref:hypothetical protein n=1 Tax=Streptomyces sp. NEAU-YJ-81 TaxID=2820288 RepID=UPI0027E13ED4|nr:hypothetical protein [Streptomyces sp. NEAU-YJ-81]
MKSPECGAGEPVEQGGEEYAVGRSEPGFGDLALKDGQLVVQGENLDVLVGVGHRRHP